MVYESRQSRIGPGRNANQRCPRAPNPQTRSSIGVYWRRYMCWDSRIPKIKASVVVSCIGHSIACSFAPARRPSPISHRPDYPDLITLPFASSSTKTTSCLQTSTPPLHLRQTFQKTMLPPRLRRLHHPPQSIPKQGLLIPEVSRPLHRPSPLQSPPPTTLLSTLVSFSASCKPYDQY